MCIRDSVYIGLDATDSVIREAADKGADLLLTHHPLLFHGINRVTDQDFLGNRVLNLIRSDISYYAMHTNYDAVSYTHLDVYKRQLIRRSTIWSGT